MDDGELDLTIFNGSVRNSENEEIAKLLRQKSKLLVAFGSCAYMGGIPGLANLTTRNKILETAYLHNPSIESGNGTVPQPESRVDGVELDIPRFYRRVYRLDDIVDVDYYLPGCPPQADQVRAVVLLAIVDGQLPAEGIGRGRQRSRALRGLSADEEREEDQPLLPPLGDNGRSRDLPSRAGHPVLRAGHPIGVRGAVSKERDRLPRLLWTGAWGGRSGRQAGQRRCLGGRQQGSARDRCDP